MELQALKNRFGIIGNAPALNYALSVAERVASTDLTVFISGESGVGKEVFSQIIHALSNRKHNPLIAVNCGAIPEGTIDSELFGHEKGAFTGATDKRKGYFETVEGGTIFLDEIGEMPIGTQARLLRLLQNGEFIKVGSSVVQKTNVRVIAATNVDLPELIRKGKFREDLYYRLNTVPIEVPALRDRGDDIYQLFRKFSIDFAEKNNIQPIKLDEGAKLILQRYNWPGNVRQLKNVAEQSTILSVERELDMESIKRFLPNFDNRLPVNSMGSSNGEYSDRDLLYKMLFDIKQDVNDLKHFMLKMSGGNYVPDPFERAPSNFNPSITPLPSSINEYRNDHTFESNQPVIVNPNVNNTIHAHSEVVEENLNLADMEKELIIKALKKHKGKRRLAAEELHISDRTLYRKIEEYKIDL